MTPRKTYEKGEKQSPDLMTKLYQVVKNIDGRLESILDELRDAVDGMQEEGYQGYGWERGLDNGY